MVTDGDFLSCDWGTTSFRLRWVRGAERKVVREIREPAGIKSLHEEANRSGAGTKEARENLFASFLRSKVEELLAGEKPPQHPMPLFISGMASSTVGWRELPYAKTPFSLDGRGVRAELLEWNKPEWVGPTHLISGVATAQEMMRGEETEIIGLMAEPSLGALREQCLLILPGTHSKHVQIENHSVVDWRTFMTGELFEVLGRHSLLRASVDLGVRTASDSLSEVERAAFREGVLWAKEHDLAGGLFRVRTRAVLGRCPLPENTWFFSGLLIGSELAGLCSSADQRPIILAAARGLSEPYALALELIADRTIQPIQIPPERVEQATIAAHALLLTVMT
jgi:2-dehydro-3-deoxygalactonokinase